MGIAQRFDVEPDTALAIRHELHQAKPGKTQTCGQFPFLHRRRNTKANQITTAAQIAVGIPTGLVTNGIEGSVESFGNELPDAIEKIFRAIVYRRGTKSGNEFELGFGSCAEHAQAGDLTKLESGGANTSASAVNEEALAFAKFSDAVDHLVGGDVIQDEADGLGGIQIVRHGNQMRGGDEEVAAVASNHGERGDTLAGREAGDAIAESVNVADDVIAGSEGKGLLNGIEAVPHEDVGIGNAGGDDFDAHLTWTRIWQVVLDPLENFRATATGDDDAGVFRWRHHRNLTQTSR